MTKIISDIIYDKNFKIKFKNNSFNVLVNEDFLPDNDLAELIKSVSVIDSPTGTKVWGLYPEERNACRLGFVTDEKNNVIIKNILIRHIEYDGNQCLLSFYNLDKDAPKFNLGHNLINVELSWHGQPINKKQYDFIDEINKKISMFSHNQLNYSFSAHLIKATFPAKNITNFDNQRLINDAIFNMVEAYGRLVTFHDKNKLVQTAEIEKVKEVINIILEEAINSKETINKIEAETFVSLVDTLTKKIYEKNKTPNFNKIEKIVNSL